MRQSVGDIKVRDVTAHLFWRGREFSHFWFPLQSLVHFRFMLDVEEGRNQEKEPHFPGPRANSQTLSEG